MHLEDTGFIQLERRGLHHSNSHVGHMMVAGTGNNEADDEVPHELEEGSNDEDDRNSEDGWGFDDEDEDSEDGNDAISADDSM